MRSGLSEVGTKLNGVVDIPHGSSDIQRDQTDWSNALSSCETALQRTSLGSQWTTWACSVYLYQTTSTASWAALGSQKAKGGDPSLHSPLETQLECCVQFWGFSESKKHKRDKDCLEWFPHRTIKMIWDWSIFHMRRYWVCSAWRRESSGESYKCI